MITAIVLVSSDVHAIPETAQSIADLENVSEVYSVSGEWDLVAMVRVRDQEEVAGVVTGKIAKIPGVTKTETLIAFQAYSRHDLDRLFAIGFQESD
jgi:DNA-binding Lrp family transcriptional regulator